MTYVNKVSAGKNRLSQMLRENGLSVYHPYYPLRLEVSRLGRSCSVEIDNQPYLSIIGKRRKDLDSVTILTSESSSFWNDPNDFCGVFTDITVIQSVFSSFLYNSEKNVVGGDNIARDWVCKRLIRS